MKVGKILNNNVVVVFESGKTEKIVMGRGIAFGKKVGDTIDEEKIDKTFLLENSDNNSKLQQLLKQQERQMPLVFHISIKACD